MKTRWLLLFAGVLAFAGQAQETTKELWKWTDPNGVVHYSDVPGPGAIKVDLAVTEGQSKPAATRPAPTTSSAAAKPAAAQATTYNVLEIWQPANETSFFEANTTVGVRIRSEPAVASDDSLYLFLDGKLVEGPANSVDYSVSGVERGAHSLTALIQDARGKEKIRSKAVVFYIKQPTTIAPGAVGPNVKPPPTAKPKRGG
jgi:hypothetical protein